MTQKFGTITVAADKKTITITPINDNATEGGSNITTGHAGLATTVTFEVVKDGKAIELKDDKNNTTAIPTITLTVTPSTKYAAVFASDYTVKADLTKDDSNIKTAVITELNKTLKLTGDEALTADAVKYVSKDQAVVQLEPGIKAVIALEQLTAEELALQDYFSKVNVEENNGLVKVKYDAFNDTTVTTLNNWYADAKIEYTVDGQTKTAYLSDANLSTNRGSVANQTETREFEISEIVAALGINLKGDTVYNFKVTPVLVDAKTGKVTENTKVESGTAKEFTYKTAPTVASATADYFEKVAVSESEGTVTVTYNPLKDTTASLLTGLYADAEIVVKKGTVQTEKVYLSQANGNKRGLASEQTGNKPFSIPTVMSAIEGLSTLPKGEYTVELTPILVNAATTQAIGNDTTIYKGTPTTITYEK